MQANRVTALRTQIGPVLVYAHVLHRLYFRWLEAPGAVQIARGSDERAGDIQGMNYSSYAKRALSQTDELCVNDFMICRYCSQPLAESEAVKTHSYWGGLPFVCHAACKQAGEREEAFECQCIDADCNDCKHYQRGKLAPLVRSWLHKPDGRRVEVTHQPNVFIGGRCLKFDKPTEASPNKWTGHECFEHRRTIST